MSRFHALKTLSLNYNYLSDEVMSRLTTHLRGNLEVFSILCKNCGSISNVISDDSWTALRKKCPLMRVYFRLELEDLRTTFVLNSNILSPTMPLVSMQYVLHNTWTMMYDQPIFDYLTETFADTLNLWDKISSDFPAKSNNTLHPFRHFNQIGCNLRIEGPRRPRGAVGGDGRHLQVHHAGEPELEAEIPVLRDARAFDSILGALFQQMMDKGTMSLKLFRATFRGLCPDRRKDGIFLQKTYVPRFREIGIRLKLKIKK
ncbi:hypothetical protein CEXT_683171 [Caerostris extrusa]|uniref:Uncharacterized protein n=1 Tax=Caerostris extrusa TaxID=172846 RepID=A0AAV4V8L4_CAEEX|nr:hypothetical protein CEXT_683171 [Caerostris extrusa]